MNNKRSFNFTSTLNGDHIKEREREYYMNPTKQHRISLCLTKEEYRQLKVLCEKYQENKSRVFIRALELLYLKEESKSNI